MSMKKTVNRILKILKILKMLCLLSFILLSSLSMHTIYQNCVMQTSLNNVEIIYSETAENELYSKMKDINSDYKGWLTVYGTAIDGPVVQGADNTEYLRKDFFGDTVISGSYFLDENVTDNSNLIIYGHMMRDDTMFGPLKNYKDIEFFKNNKIISWQTENSTEYYELFAGMIVSGSANDTDYLNIQDWTEVLNEQGLEIIKERSFIFLQDISIPYKKEKYLFLVTCENFYNDNKIVLVSKKM